MPLKVFTHRSATLTVRNLSYVKELVFAGPMTPKTFAWLYVMALPHLDDDAPFLADTRGMIPLADGAAFVCPPMMLNDCAVVVSPANSESAARYSLAASSSGVVKMIFYEYDQALAWVVRRRLAGLKYPAPEALPDCDL